MNKLYIGEDVDLSESTYMEDVKNLDLSLLTLENDTVDVSEESAAINNLIDEMDRVSEDIIKFQDGAIDDIVTTEALTTEVALGDIISVSYKKLKDKDTTILERAYDYIRGLINSIISYLKKAMVKHRAANIKINAEIEKLDYLELEDKMYDSKSDVVIYIRDNLADFVNNETSTFEAGAVNYVTSREKIKWVSDTISGYNKFSMVARPPQKIIDGTLSTEVGSVRSDILKQWEKGYTDTFSKIVKKGKTSRALALKTNFIYKTNNAPEDLSPNGGLIPFSSNGNEVAYIYLTIHGDLKLGKGVVKPRITTGVSVSQLPAVGQSLLDSDLISTVKSDIETLNRIEKDAKVYFKNIKKELGADAGKGHVSFNHIVTLVNSCLTISNNRLTLANKLKKLIALAVREN